MDVRHKITADVQLNPVREKKEDFHVCVSVFNSQTRHQNGDTHFLTLDEILDETKLLDISMKQKQWLMTEVCLRFLCYLLYIITALSYTL